MDKNELKEAVIGPYNYIKNREMLDNFTFCEN